MSAEDEGGASSGPHDELTARDERLVGIRRAHRRLQHLYDISRLLACFESVERTMPEVMAIFAEALALDSAIFILDRRGSPETFVWQVEADSGEHLRAAKVHAQTAYRYLMPSGVDLDGTTTRTFALPERPEQPPRPEAHPETKKNFVLLPLALEHGRVIGALQLEGTHRLDERDLAFMSATLDQLAIAVDQCAPHPVRADASGDSHRTADAMALADASMARCLSANILRVAVPTLVEHESLHEEVKDDAMQHLRLDFNALHEARLHALSLRARRSGDAQSSRDLGDLLQVLEARRALLADNQNAAAPRGSRRPLDRIQRSAEHMNRLLADLLDAASIEARSFSVEPGVVDVAPIVAAAIETCAPLAASKSLSVVSEVETGSRAVHADSTRLEQILASLLANATRFTPRWGTVTMRVAPADGGTLFSVSDTGPGIPEDDRHHLFDRFWHAEHHARVGSGLSLFIVKEIVEAHGGRIWVESTLGSGSTFFFVLPVAGPPLRDAAPAARAPLDGHLPSCRTTPSADPVRSSIDRRAALLVEFAQGLDLRRQDLQSVLESRRVARELARRAGDFRRDLMAVVSDALRSPSALQTPISPNDGRGSKLPPVGQQQTIRRMFAAMSRLTSLIESLVIHAQIRGGPLTADIESCSARAIAVDVLDELRPSANAKGLALRVREVGRRAPLRRDPALVRLVLLNLVENAIKFTDRGLVEVVVECGPHAHRLAVIDSGPGIPTADHSRIFEPFIGTAGRHISGMGLGLTLVREVASALGGQVDIESEQGSGSAFTVTLPRIARDLLEQGVSLH